MKFDISSFTKIAKPLLNKLAEQFPLSLHINVDRYEAPDFNPKKDIPLLEGTLYFLLENGYVSHEGSTYSNAYYHLTEKGLTLLNINFEKEFNKTSSVYEQGKVGC